MVEGYQLTRVKEAWAACVDKQETRKWVFDRFLHTRISASQLTATIHTEFYKLRLQSTQLQLQ